MSAPTKTYDILIVGCGPVGATLANLLRQRGHSVAIFDRDEEVFAAPRAMAIDPESCRIFQSLGVQQRLEIEDARPAARHIFVDPRRKPLLELYFTDAEERFGYSPAGLRFHQPSLERFLRDDFAKDGGVDAFLGYEVLEVDGEGPTAQLKARRTSDGSEHTFEGQYLIGADGGGSLCRKYIGAERIDYNYSRQWIVIDIVVHDQSVWDEIIDRSEFRCQPDGAIVYVKGHHNHVRFDFEIAEDKAESFTEDDARALIAEYIDTSSIEFLRLQPYHFYAGMPASWRKGRVFLAGDAAHLTSPFSGQGLNMGIRDAANLDFKLDLVLRGLADDRLLDTYEQERWSNCERVIEGATQRGLMISTSTRWGLLKQRFGFWLGRVAPQLTLRAMAKSSIGFPYTDGLVGEQEQAGLLSLQPRVRKASGDEVLLDELLGRGFALLLRHSDGPSEAIDWFVQVLDGTVLVVGEDFDDHDGKLERYLEEQQVNSLLLRPDRYIFDAGDSGSALCERLRTALSAYGLSRSAPAA